MPAVAEIVVKGYSRDLRERYEACLGDYTSGCSYCSLVCLTTLFFDRAHSNMCTLLVKFINTCKPECTS